MFFSVLIDQPLYSVIGQVCTFHEILLPYSVFKVLVLVLVLKVLNTSPQFARCDDICLIGCVIVISGTCSVDIY